MTHRTARTPRPLPSLLLGPLLAASLALPAAAADLADLAGKRQVLLHGRDGSRVHLSEVAFTPQADGRSRFLLTLHHEPFKDFFLSMKEFKCVDSASEIFCHVP